MAGFCRMTAMAAWTVALLLTSTSSARAFGCYGYWYWPSVVSYYYAPMPVYGYSWASPVQPCPLVSPGRVIDLEKPAVKPERKPTMPPTQGSANQESDRQPPAIIASPAGEPGKAISLDRCRVAFWNLSGRDVQLTVEGKSWTLARNREMTLDLGRSFAWQVGDGVQHVERVPDGEAAFELVIR
jgi:hypothetical protein